MFAGTFSNIDTSGMAQHWVTMQKYNGTTYTPELTQVPVPFGSTSKCPKMVLNAGESLYVQADAASAIAVSMEILVLP